MTPRFVRVEDSLREMRSPVAPVDDPESVEARRRRTVAHLQRLQGKALAHREIAGAWRRRVLVAALVLFPSGALAGTWAVLRTPGPSAVAHESGGTASQVAPSRRPARSPTPNVTDSVLVDSAPSDPFAGSVPSDRLRHAAETPDRTAATSDDDVVPGSRSTLRAVRVAAEMASPTRAAASASHASAAAFPALDGVSRDSDPSTLAAENAMMQRAMTAARGGDDARAMALLGEFLERYPRSPLAQNAEVERFRAARRLGDARTASRLARRYLGAHPDGMARDEARRVGVEASSPSSDAQRR